MDPTQQTYDELRQAYDYFNARLFAGGLPHCLITMQRKGRTLGYFAGERFGTRDGESVTDEIAMNPVHFRGRTVEQTLSTLVHEMTHVQQHHQGNPSRAGYHNAEWGGLMRVVGLMPSNTGEPGGKATGQRVTHYVEVDGPFDLACRALVATGFSLAYVDLWDDAAKRGKKAASKTKYTCPDCEANAWAKPDMKLVCGDCDQPMRPE